MKTKTGRNEGTKRIWVKLCPNSQVPGSCGSFLNFRSTFNLPATLSHSTLAFPLACSNWLGLKALRKIPLLIVATLWKAIYQLIMVERQGTNMLQGRKDPASRDWLWCEESPTHSSTFSHWWQLMLDAACQNLRGSIFNSQTRRLEIQICPALI